MNLWNGNEFDLQNDEHKRKESFRFARLCTEIRFETELRATRKKHLFTQKCQYLLRAIS